MTSSVCVGGWSWWLWLWLVSARWRDVNAAANSLSVLDSKLTAFYQNYAQPYRGYDVYEPGFVADPDGYENRNAFKPRRSGGSTTKNSLKSGPGKHLVDDGYNTRTIPLYQDYHHAGGYATQNAFQPHHSAGKDGYPADDGYSTRTIGFPLYQKYQHSYKAEPEGYATRNAYHPYHEHAGTIDDGYQTRTTYHGHQHPPDPGGYATQTVYQPYRSGIESKTEDSRYVDDANYKAVDDGKVFYRQIYYPDEEEEEENEDYHGRYVSSYSGDNGELSATPTAATDEYNSLVLRPTQPSISAV